MDFVNWDEDYKDNSVYTELVPELEKIAKEHNVSDNDVRFVFGFDS